MHAFSINQIAYGSRPEVFCKKGALRNFTKFTGKHLCQSLFFNKDDVYMRPEMKFTRSEISLRFEKNLFTILFIAGEMKFRFGGGRI